MSRFRGGSFIVKNVKFIVLQSHAAVFGGLGFSFSPCFCGEGKTKLSGGRSDGGERVGDGWSRSSLCG